MALRTRAIDDVVGAASRTGIRQFVILGAGLDSRAVRLPELRDAMVFEVDRPELQRYKAARLSALGLSVHNVQRVECELGRGSLASVLQAARFRPDERSLWLCEGVTMYLSAATWSALLREISEVTAPSSWLGFTYMPKAEHGDGWFIRLARLVAAGAREPLLNVFRRDELEPMLAEAAFSLLRDEGRLEWVERYWPGGMLSRDLERLCVAEREQ